MKHCLLATVAACALSTAAQAQQMQHVSFSVPKENVKYNVSQNLDIRDVPNHFVRMFETQAKLSNASVNGVELAEVFLSGVNEVTNGSSFFRGYMVFVANNGDKFYSQNAAVAQVGADGSTAVMWNGLITGGTGQFAGIHGFTRTVNTALNITSNAPGSPQYEIDYTIPAAVKSGTAEEAKAMLAKAVAAVKADRDVALAMFNKGEGGFKQGDLYPFCFRMSDGKAVAGGGTPNGDDIRTTKDAVGKASGLEIYAAGQKPEGQITEVTYTLAKLGTTQPVFPKVSFVTRVADLVCGVGYYK
jgi:hypothetical protein